IARGIGEDYGVKVRKLNYYMRDDVVRIGSSFDFEVVGLTDGHDGDETLRDLYREHGPGILEIKNVDWLIFRDWITDDGDLEAPAYIEAQHQHQLCVSSRKWGLIAALVGGNQPRIMPRLADPAVAQGIRNRAAQVWASLEQGTAPAPEFARDADFVASLYGYAEKGKVLDARSDSRIKQLMNSYKQAAAAEKEAQTNKKAAKAEMLTLIGTAEKVLADGFTLSVGVIKGTEYTVKRDDYRMFRVTEKKPAKTIK